MLLFVQGEGRCYYCICNDVVICVLAMMLFVCCECCCYLGIENDVVSCVLGMLCYLAIGNAVVI